MQLNPAGRSDCFFQQPCPGVDIRPPPARVCATYVPQLLGSNARTSSSQQPHRRPSLLTRIADDFGGTYGEDSLKHMPWPNPYTSTSRPGHYQVDNYIAERTVAQEEEAARRKQNRRKRRVAENLGQPLDPGPQRRPESKEEKQGPML